MRQGAKLDTDIESTNCQVHENMLAVFGIDPSSQPWAGNQLSACGRVTRKHVRLSTNRATVPTEKVKT